MSVSLDVSLARKDCGLLSDADLAWEGRIHLGVSEIPSGSCEHLNGLRAGFEEMPQMSDPLATYLHDHLPGWFRGI
jgi:hypothetical protein